MISNERPSRFDRQPYQQAFAAQPPRPPVREDTLKTGAVVIERKTVIISLNENLRGRFLRITEQTIGKSISVIIPATGLAEFKKLIDEMVKVAGEIPAKNGPAAA